MQKLTYVNDTSAFNVLRSPRQIKNPSKECSRAHHIESSLRDNTTPQQKEMRACIECDEAAEAGRDSLLEALEVDPLPHEEVPRAEMYPVLSCIGGACEHLRHLLWVCISAVISQRWCSSDGKGYFVSSQSPHPTMTVQ